MANSIDNQALMQAIFLHRKSQKMNREAAAIAINISAVQLGKIERGEATPNLPHYLRICDWLGVSADKFRLNPIVLVKEIDAKTDKETALNILMNDNKLKPEYGQTIIQVIEMAYASSAA